MKTDPFDQIHEQWKEQRPDLDTSGLEVVGRILYLSKKLKNSARKELAKLGVDLWAFEVLSALRRQGEPYRMIPSEISRAVVISSGAMTNRLDRLEVEGLIERRPDPKDRRSIQIELTPAGLELIEKGMRIRAEDANNAVEALGEEERMALVNGLRKLLASPGK